MAAAYGQTKKIGGRGLGSSFVPAKVVEGMTRPRPAKTPGKFRSALDGWLFRDVAGTSCRPAYQRSEVHFLDELAPRRNFRAHERPELGRWIAHRAGTLGMEPLHDLGILQRLDR